MPVSVTFNLFFSGGVVGNECAVGYSGYLCQECTNNGSTYYIRTNPYICGECPSKLVNIIKFGIFILIICILLIVLIRYFNIIKCLEWA